MHLHKLLRYSCAIILMVGIHSLGFGQSQNLQGWETNTEKSLIDLSELKRGGPPKDGIPSIDNPTFVEADAAQSWISSKEPVIAFEHNGQARAYPLQILIWHEIVNDKIAGDPI